MTQQDREIQRRLRILKYAEETGHVGRTCRYFGIGRASFYRWKSAFEKHGESGLARKKPIPKNPKNRTPPEIVEKVLHLRKTYHLGPMRIVWYLARYHDIKISAAGVSRKGGILVGAMEKLPVVIDTLIAAVRTGELDNGFMPPKSGATTTKM